MTKTVYLKDGATYYLRPKTVSYDGMTICNPQDEHLIAAGYEIVEQEIEEIPPYTPTYEDLVVEYIRERYDMNLEFAILRLRDTKSEEFQEYFNYCEECKNRAKLITNELEEIHV